MARASRAIAKLVKTTEMRSISTYFLQKNTPLDSYPYRSSPFGSISTHPARKSHSSSNESPAYAPTRTMSTPSPSSYGVTCLFGVWLKFSPIPFSVYRSMKKGTCRPCAPILKDSGSTYRYPICPYRVNLPTAPPEEPIPTSTLKMSQRSMILFGM